MEFQQIIQINERLRFLWEGYIGMVNLLITLSTGALAVSTGLLRLDNSRPFSSKTALKFGLSLLVLALFSALMWRIIAQVFMEQEVFGNPSELAVYYQVEKVIPFTSSYEYASQPFHNIFRVIIIICMFVTAVSLPLGLALVAVFVFRNLR